MKPLYHRLAALANRPESPEDVETVKEAHQHPLASPAQRLACTLWLNGRRNYETYFQLIQLALDLKEAYEDQDLNRPTL
jgi:hypothetical protein